MNITLLVFFLHDSIYGQKIRGDERRFLELSRRFHEKGIKMHVLEHYNLQKALYGKLTYTPIITGLIPGKRSKVSEILRLFKLLVITIVVALKLKYDIIYVHNQDFENVFFAFLAKIVSRKPMVIVVHYISSDNAGSKKHLLTMPIRYFKDLLWRVILRNVDALITVSRYVAMQTISRIKPESRKIYVCGNGVDIHRFKPLNLPKVYDAAFLGRIDFNQKGVDILLKAWALVRSKDPNTKLIIIGGGTEEDYYKLKLMISKLSLTDNVIVTKFVSDTDLLKLLNESKVFVFPSRFEGFGLAPLEAMACGLPCIVTNIPVLKDLHNNIVILVKPDNYKVLADRILELLRDRDLIKELSIRSREHAMEFRWERVEYCETKVFENLLKKGKESILFGDENYNV
jgi:glycosyltransferase involved in cell wall biosynthesis